jgi:hypothetical protein
MLSCRARSSCCQVALYSRACWRPGNVRLANLGLVTKLRSASHCTVLCFLQQGCIWPFHLKFTFDLTCKSTFSFDGRGQERWMCAHASTAHASMIGCLQAVHADTSVDHDHWHTPPLRGICAVNRQKRAVSLTLVESVHLSSCFVDLRTIEGADVL